jgi:type VI secretion system protein ImpA
MALDIGALVAPLSDEQPSGPDMYGDPNRQAIEDAFERSISVEAAEEDETDWRGTLTLIREQAEITRDLWLPVYMMRAAARSGNFESVCDGAELLAALLEERWDDVHPQLDEVGFIGRKTPCESLTRLADFLGPLNRVPLLSHPRLGRYSGEDLVRFADQGVNADGYGMFRALLEETPVEDLEALAAQVDGLLQAIRRADTVLTANAEGDTSTNFQPTYTSLGDLAKAVKSYLPEPEVESAGDDDGWSESGSSGGNTGGGGAGFTGGIGSRRDVERALDAICAYYARNEPGSPVPFVLRRAREWISLDFMAVLEDIAPGGIDEAGKILKSTRVASSSSAGWDDGASSSSSDDSWSSSSSDSDDGWS